MNLKAIESTKPVCRAICEGNLILFIKLSTESAISRGLVVYDRAVLKNIAAINLREYITEFIKPSLVIIAVPIFSNT
jgi:hypothetical protein